MHNRRLFQTLRSAVLSRNSLEMAYMANIQGNNRYIKTAEYIIKVKPIRNNNIAYKP